MHQHCSGQGRDAEWVVTGDGLAPPLERSRNGFGGRVLLYAHRRGADHHN
jgi:hypothetical protein